MMVASPHRTGMSSTSGFTNSVSSNDNIPSHINVVSDPASSAAPVLIHGPGTVSVVFASPRR